MTKVTNNTREVVDLPVKDGKVRDGVPETVAIEPGQTVDVSIDLESASIQGRILGGAISVPKNVAERVEERASAPSKGK